VGRMSMIPAPGDRFSERSRQRGASRGQMDVDNLARPRPARHNSNRVAAREIILEAEILLQRLLHLSAPPADEETVLLEMARHVYGGRRLRERIFGPGLFADPSWDILLDLYVAKREGRKVTISSACIAASAPTTTATRHISHLVQQGLVMRVPHPVDARSSYLQLSAASERKLTQLFKEMVQAADDRA
jgi:hypothetical protein